MGAINAIWSEEMAKQYPKYSAEAAQLAAKEAARSRYKTGWIDPRGLSYLSSDEERKAMDKKINDEYDSLFWSTPTPSERIRVDSSGVVSTSGSPLTWSTTSSSSWFVSTPKEELSVNPFLDKVVNMEYVGSRVTCSPAPTDTDEDVLLLTDDLETLIGDCIEVGFTRDGDTKASYPVGFVSLRNGSMNFIVTDDEEFYKKFMLATHVCKSLNVMSKIDRIIVFQAILYNNKS
jgi:hypothetical protein